MFFPPNFPLYKASMDAYSTKTTSTNVDFDFENNTGFKNAMSEAFAKAMDDKSNQAVRQRDKARDRLQRCTHRFVAERDARVVAENARVGADDARVDAENARRIAETSREQAETRLRVAEKSLGRCSERLQNKSHLLNVEKKKHTDVRRVSNSVQNLASAYAREVQQPNATFAETRDLMTRVRALVADMDQGFVSSLVENVMTSIADNIRLKKECLRDIGELQRRLGEQMAAIQNNLDAREAELATEREEHGQCQANLGVARDDLVEVRGNLAEKDADLLEERALRAQCQEDLGTATDAQATAEAARETAEAAQAAAETNLQDAQTQVAACQTKLDEGQRMRTEIGELGAIYVRELGQGGPAFGETRSRINAIRATIAGSDEHGVITSLVKDVLQYVDTSIGLNVDCRQKIEDTRRQLAQELAATKADLGRQKFASERCAQELGKARVARDVARSDLAERDTELVGVRANLRTARTEAAEARRDLEARVADLNRVTEEHVQCRTDLAEAQNEREVALMNMNEAQTRLATCQEKLAMATATLDEGRRMNAKVQELARVYSREFRQETTTFENTYVLMGELGEMVAQSAESGGVVATLVLDILQRVRTSIDLQEDCRTKIEETRVELNEQLSVLEGRLEPMETELGREKEARAQCQEKLEAAEKLAAEKIERATTENKALTDRVEQLETYAAELGTRHQQSEDDLAAERAQLALVEEIALVVVELVSAYRDGIARGGNVPALTHTLVGEIRGRVVDGQLSRGVTTVLHVIDDLLERLRNCIEAKDEMKAKLEKEMEDKKAEVKELLEKERAKVRDKEAENEELVSALQTCHDKLETAEAALRTAEREIDNLKDEIEDAAVDWYDTNEELNKCRGSLEKANVALLHEKQLYLKIEAIVAKTLELVSSESDAEFKENLKAVREMLTELSALRRTAGTRDLEFIFDKLELVVHKVSEGVFAVENDMEQLKSQVNDFAEMLSVSKVKLDATEKKLKACEGSTQTLLDESMVSEDRKRKTTKAQNRRREEMSRVMSQSHALIYHNLKNNVGMNDDRKRQEALDASMAQADSGDHSVIEDNLHDRPLFDPNTSVGDTPALKTPERKNHGRPLFDTTSIGDTPALNTPERKNLERPLFGATSVDITQQTPPSFGIGLSPIPGSPEYDTFGEPWTHDLALGFDSLIHQLRVQPDENLLVKYGLPLLGPNSADKVSNTMKDLSYNPRARNGHAIVRLLGKLLFPAGLEVTPDLGVERPVHDGKTGSYDLSQSEAFKRFLSMRQFLVGHYANTVSRYNTGYFASVHLFLLVVEKLNTLDDRSTATPESFPAQRLDGAGSAQGPLSSQPQLDLGRTVRNLRFAVDTPPFLTPTSATGVLPGWTEDIIDDLDKQASQTKSDQLLQKVGRYVFHPVTFQEIGNDDTAIEKGIMLLLDPDERLKRRTGVFKYPIDVFDDRVKRRPFQFLNWRESGGIVYDGDLSLTDAFATFVRLRKYIISKSRELFFYYTADRTANVRLFLLVISRLGLEANGVTVYKDRKSNTSLTDPEPTVKANSMLSSLFMWF